MSGTDVIVTLRCDADGCGGRVHLDHHAANTPVVLGSCQECGSSYVIQVPSHPVPSSSPHRLRGRRPGARWSGTNGLDRVPVR